MHVRGSASLSMQLNETPDSCVIAQLALGRAWNQSKIEECKDRKVNL